MKTALTLFFLIYVLLSLSSDAMATDFKVTFINPGVSTLDHTTGGFWYNVSAFMKAVAEDFNIELEVLYAERNHLMLPRLVQKAANQKRKPDYLIIVNEMKQGETQLQKAMDAGIKTFMMLNTLTDQKSIQKFGASREKYKNWIGSLIPDNQFAGYRIAKTVIDKALQEGVTAKDGKLHLVGMAGDYVTPAAIERNDGLKKAVAEYTNVDLKQIFVCNWSKDTARDKTLHILNRYPEVGAFWAANDPIALGTIEAIIASGKKPGRDIFIGGLNWDKPALEKIKDGMLTISMGGHFMTGGWTMVLLYDYHHGKDFAEEGVALKMKIFDEINATNIEEYQQKFGDRNWDSIDFTRFSKVRNPNLKKYSFSLAPLLQQKK
ncbi:MAG: ABC transporter substrate-binding protein [Pseudomonadota bacterium]